jgi:hypothetical protein
MHRVVEHDCAMLSGVMPMRVIASAYFLMYSGTAEASGDPLRRPAGNEPPATKNAKRERARGRGKKSSLLTAHFLAAWRLGGLRLSVRLA